MKHYTEFLTIASLCCASFLVGCSEKIVLEETSISELSLEATYGQIPTKVGFDRQGKFYWTAQDCIGALTTVSGEHFQKMEIATGTGSGHAVFNAAVEGSLKDYAIYPYDGLHSMTSSVLNYHFPSEYTYDSVDTDWFSAKQGYGNSFRAAMFGKIISGKVSMRHLGGIICVKVPSLPASEGKLILSTLSSKINGDFRTDLLADVPELSLVSSTEPAEREVAITYSNGEVGKSGVFYFPLPCGRIEGAKLHLQAGSEGIDMDIATLNIERRHLITLEMDGSSQKAAKYNLLQEGNDRIRIILEGDEFSPEKVSNLSGNQFRLTYENDLPIKDGKNSPLLSGEIPVAQVLLDETDHSVLELLLTEPVYNTDRLHLSCSRIGAITTTSAYLEIPEGKEANVDPGKYVYLQEDFEQVGADCGWKMVVDSKIDDPGFCTFEAGVDNPVRKGANVSAKVFYADAGTNNALDTFLSPFFDAPSGRYILRFKYMVKIQKAGLTPHVIKKGKSTQDESWSNKAPWIPLSGVKKDTWINVERIFNGKSSAKDLRLSLRLNKFDGIIYFDDVSLVRQDLRPRN